MSLAIDTLAYAERVRQAGFTEEQAAGLARALAAAMTGSLATKQDHHELEPRFDATMRRLEIRFDGFEQRLEAKLEAGFARLEANATRAAFWSVVIVSAVMKLLSWFGV